jgi:hypothetical protein
MMSQMTYGPGELGLWGTGITVTSINFNIFDSAQVSFINPPTNSPQTCTKFNYRYNDINNVEVDGKKIYVIFCPIDNTFDVKTTDADISLVSP